MTSTWPKARQELARKTPLKRTELKTKKPWRPERKRLLRTSKKGRRFEAEFEAAKPHVRFRDEHCQRCGGEGEHVHHRRRRSQGGTNDLSNLLLLCHHCHAYVHAHVAESAERGWLIVRPEAES